MLENRSLASQAALLEEEIYQWVQTCDCFSSKADQHSCADELHLHEQLYREEVLAQRDSLYQVRAMVKRFRAHKFENVAEEADAVLSDLAAAGETELKHIHVLDADCGTLTAEIKCVPTAFVLSQTVDRVPTRQVFQHRERNTAAGLCVAP